MTRLAIWNEGLGFLVTHPLTLVWGTPQSEIIKHLNELRSSSLLEYIPRGYAVLHLHNTWLDFLFQFGMVGISGIGYGLAKWYRKNKFKNTAIVGITVVLFCVS